MFRTKGEEMGSSFTNGGQGSSEVMTLYHYVSGGQTVQSTVYLRYPDLRDLIPPDATLTSVQLVTTHEDDQLSPFDVQAKAITTAWDPRTVSSQSLPAHAQWSSFRNGHLGSGHRYSAKLAQY
jgi:hypothetical protein